MIPAIPGCLEILFNTTSWTLGSQTVMTLLTRVIDLTPFTTFKNKVTDQGQQLLSVTHKHTTSRRRRRRRRNRHDHKHCTCGWRKQLETFRSDKHPSVTPTARAFSDTIPNKLLLMLINPRHVQTRYHPQLFCASTQSALRHVQTHIYHSLSPPPPPPPAAIFSVYAIRLTPIDSPFQSHHCCSLNTTIYTLHTKHAQNHHPKQM